MKRVTIEIDERYANILSLTAIGGNKVETRATTVLVDPHKENHVWIDETGETHKEYRKEEEDATD